MPYPFSEADQGYTTDAAEAKNAQLEAVKKGLDIGEVLIIAVCYAAEVDRQAGSAHPRDLAFGLNTWSSGLKASSPPEAVAEKLGSFDVLDAIAKHYLDRSKFPNMEVRYFAKPLVIEIACV